MNATMPHDKYKFVMHKFTGCMPYFEVQMWSNSAQKYYAVCASASEKDCISYMKNNKDMDITSIHWILCKHL